MVDHVAKLLDLARGLNAVPGPTSLDETTAALVLVGALIAIGAAPAAYCDAVNVALAAGASPDDIVDALVTVCAAVGSARRVSASRGLSIALGYDIDVALEDR